MKILMCSPNFYNVEYDINPWMRDQINQVNKTAAIYQWESLHHTVKKFAKVELLHGISGLPDMVFTANAGFVQGSKVILSKFAKPERQPEAQYFKDWFSDRGFEIYQTVYSYEGEGDHLVDNRGRHWVGHGFRTDKRVASELNYLLGTEVNMLELVNPKWYHLDTCFCPLPNGELVWYPGAFSKDSQDLIENSFVNRISISKQDAEAFTCNIVCLGQNLIVPTNNETSPILRNLGYNVYDINLSEFIKAGGAAKCLVLKIHN